MRIFISVIVAALLAADAFADNAFFSARIVTLFAPNPDIRIFHIDGTKYPAHMAKESDKQYQKRVDAFIETQCHSSKQLSDSQKQQLMKVLLNNMSGTCYCIAGDSPTLGMNIKANGDSATLLFGRDLVYSFHKGKEIDDLQSRDLREWINEYKKENKLE